MSHHLTVPALDTTPYMLLADAAKQARAGDVLVDVGAGFGHSTCFLMEALMAAQSKARLYAMDPFGPCDPAHGESRTGALPWGEPFDQWYARQGQAAMWDAFTFYTRQSPAHAYLHDYAQFPAAAGGEFAGLNVTFVYLHYSRTAKWLAHDVASWWEVLVPGGELLVQSSPEAINALNRPHAAPGNRPDFALLTKP